MLKRETINTPQAPEAIGTYSQAVKAGGFLYVSGQIPLDPTSMQLVAGGIAEQTERVFENISAIVSAAKANMQNCVKVNISMTDLSGFVTVNDIMSRYFDKPYPARGCVEVAALPKGSLIEIETIFICN